MWSYAQLKACVRVAIVGSWAAECLYVSLARQAAFELLTVVAFRGQVNFEVPPSTRDQWLNSQSSLCQANKKGAQIEPRRGLDVTVRHLWG